MVYRLLADLVVVVHALFVVFVLVGAFLALRWRWIVWIHIPAAIWGVLIEYGGWICPLTPLENYLRRQAGQTEYTGDFIQHYLLSALYPQGLTRQTQLILGSVALLANVIGYALVIRRRG